MNETSRVGMVLTKGYEEEFIDAWVVKLDFPSQGKKIMSGMRKKIIKNILKSIYVFNTHIHSMGIIF